MSEAVSRILRDKAKARLRRVLRDEVDGKRTCVLVLGDGVNLQAATRRERANELERVLTTV